MPVKMGIIGYGGMAGWHHEHSAETPGLEVVAAYDIDPARIAKAQEKGLKGYDSLRQFLADDSFELVLVATPNDAHCRLVLDALDAGKHVVCEKPVTLTLRDIDRMIETAQKNDRIFTVHQNRRWDKDFRIARDVLASETLGNVYSIQSRLHGSGGAMHGWRGEKKHGGGMLFDWGVHFIDQAYTMCGWDAFTSVRCRTANVKTTEVDDYFHLQFDRKDGGEYVVEIGTFVLKELPRWMLLGDQGTAYINGFARSGGVITLDNAIEDEPVIVMTSAGPTRTFAPRPDGVKTERELPDPDCHWTDYYKNVIATIEGREELIVKPEQVRRVLATILAAFRSAKTQKQIKL
ncbi:MAG: Gfo/Idh/MocA family oxidoreductase [Oscillospiraceae bacterium]|jgi:predicted dehydrogenase|nr:Gfo/Idh/MocA family oxidoreductase [Oscillospiraceae bacterium]